MNAEHQGPEALSWKDLARGTLWKDVFSLHEQERDNCPDLHCA